MEFTPKERIKTILAYCLTYLLWFISLPVAGWTILDIRDTFLTVLAVIYANKYEAGSREAFYANMELRAADTTSYIFIGIALVIVVVVIENVYRNGMFVGKLWARFFLVLAISLGVLSLNGLANDLARSAIGAFTWRALFGPAVYALLAIFFFFVSRSKRLPSTPRPETPIF